ncbi:MAG TPA: S8 family serine peptidase [Puia sp.]|nr:S8 family serine peptidase [Puia sp.]
MKHFCVITIVCCFLFSTILAQKPPRLIRFKTGNISSEKNLLGKRISNLALKDISYKKKYYLILQFDQLPSGREKNQLSNMGVRLYDYLPGNAFLAEMADSTAFQSLKTYHATAAYGLPSKLKISSKIFQQSGHADTQQRSFIAVTFFGNIDKTTVSNELRQSGAQIIFTKIQPRHVVFVNASSDVVKKIATLPFVAYISLQSLHDVPLNYNNRAIHGLDALSATSGRNLFGKNVTVGIGDNSDPSTHIDFSGRLIQRNATTVTSHGTHTTGTMAGAGILDPRYRGMAPKATIISQYFSDILVNAPTYINDNNLVLTNNSYYSGADFCPGDGEYDALSNYADEQLDANPSLLHVFAAGNDGGLTCSPYPNPFATIKSGFQCSKNILTVGAMDNMTYGIKASSSRGPVDDGRLKPEITAGGQNITSTYPYNTYGITSGTSMASPTVTGTLALLYERYRQLHGGVNPSAALIKAVACNSADDFGNPGPDFSFGFGMLNARTAVETIENNRYFIDSISNSNTITHTISGIPTGVQQVKIMLYWPDAPAAAFSPVSLVNNLDLTVTSPDATVHHPLILDPSPSGVTNNAIEGVDNVNNIEQVVINNPPAGNFTVTVKGTNIPVGPQNYVIAYQIIYPSVTVEYPFGNETWVPGQTEYIRWSAYGGAGNTFTIEYSADNGSTWNLISNNVPDANRDYAWTVPSIATTNALIRVTRNNLGYQDVSDYDFTILGQPIATVSNPCQGYAQLVWNTIPSATQYEIMMLKGDSMQTIANTTDTSYLLSGLNRNTSYWLGVRAIYNGLPGRRSLSVNIIPAGGSCSLAAFNGDFTLDSLVLPTTGRIFTSSQLGIVSPQVEIKNLGSAASGIPFNISYQVNGGSIMTETNASAIAGGTTFKYTFSNANSYNFSAPGTYTIKAWVDYPGDPQLSNDTIVTIIKHLQNDPLVLNPSYTEGFETASVQSHNVKTSGLDSLDRCDFNNNSPNGRIRTFVNTGFARTGNRCATLDQILNTGVSSSDSLITTFNLSGYSSLDQIWLDFYYKNHGIDFKAPGNMVWIRGNDQAAWILADTLSYNSNDIGIYKASKNINVTGILAAAVPSQTVGSSFQVKFGEQGITSANSVIPDGDLDDGYSFDDITLTKSSNDMGMLGLLQPALSNFCSLSNAETISIQLKNYSTNTLTNVPVTYAINNDTVTETIPSVAPNQIINYSFSQKADLSAYQNYTLRAWVNYPTDNYRKNDSLVSVNFQTTPLISSYPYLEGFESNNGYWYAPGANDDWQWGTPAKMIINRAANGSKAWVTKLAGNYSDNQISYLYSPCFDLSSLVQPVLSFSHIFQTEDDCDCDYHWVEYSTNDSVWTKLGAVGNGTNWYDNATRQAWQLSDTIWHVSSFDIPTRASKVRFRIVMFSDPATDYEGVGIDDIHIFDKTPVYNGNNINNGFTQNLSGNSWIDFDLNGQRVASINPNGQNLGTTSVKLFIDTGAIRDTTNQYYLGRNIVIQPSNAATANVSVRFYFLDSEANNLIHATGCNACSTIHDAYQSGVTQYSSPVTQEEDSTLNNNINGNYIFLKPQQDLHIIPYDNGYYAEYQVSSFSEFWINNGGKDQNSPLAAILQSFTATKVDTKGLLQWTTLQEKNTSQFIIEKSSDSIHYTDIGIVAASGNTNSQTNYQFTDNNLWNGNNYYRLKIVYADGHFTYSPIRLISLDITGFILSIFPNPVRDILYINTSINCNQVVLFDVTGKLLISANTVGFQNTLPVRNLARGVYFITVKTDSGKKTEKIVVE